MISQPSWAQFTQLRSGQRSGKIKLSSSSSSSTGNNGFCSTQQKLITFPASLHLFIDVQHERLTHFFSLDFMISHHTFIVIYIFLMARRSDKNTSLPLLFFSFNKCWQQWSREAPDGAVHMQFALWPGRLMNPFGS